MWISNYLLEDADNPDKCYYCRYYDTFRSGFNPAESSNYGACQKDSARCTHNLHGTSKESISTAESYITICK